MSDNKVVLAALKGIACAYPGGKTVLHGLNFELSTGQCVGIIGPNGSGKTTFLHVMMGLIRPDSGQIELFGQTMHGEKDFAAVRTSIGFLFQHADDQLFSPTVLEDVAFGPLNMGKPEHVARETAMVTLSRLGLEGFHDRITYRLSGGEKKLVALATILAMEPRILLLDEPTNDLDDMTRKRIIEVLNGLDIPSVIVSHDYDFLSETANTLMAMDHGQLKPSTMSVLHEHVHAHPLGTVPHRHG